MGKWLLELISVLNDEYSFKINVTLLTRDADSFKQRWGHLGKQSWISFQTGDIRYLDHLPRDVTHIVHAAAITDRRMFASNPSAVAETNGIGTLRILQATQLLEVVEKIVLLSSGLVGGAQPVTLDRIDETFQGPVRCDTVSAIYPESKRYAETVAHSFISESKLPIVTLRPFAFVGPYQSLRLPWAVNDFIRDGLEGGPIRIMGDGTTVRSIMYASDFAYSVLAALAEGAPRTTYNIGSPEPTELGALAEMIAESIQPRPKIMTNLGQAGEPHDRRVPSIERASRDLGVRVTVPLQEAIEKTILWNRLIEPHAD